MHLDFVVVKLYILKQSGLRLPNRSLLCMYFAAGGPKGLPTQYRPSAVHTGALNRRLRLSLSLSEIQLETIIRLLRLC